MLLWAVTGLQQAAIPPGYEATCAATCAAVFETQRATLCHCPEHLPPTKLPAVQLDESATDFQLETMQSAAQSFNRSPSPVEPTRGVPNVVFSLVRGTEDKDALLERSRCLARSLAGGP
eukprot:2440654-Prymnesium_polylepis.1